ncbi:hypothetical protein N9M16_05885, partial [Candidatus Dependentiae bacterium]|nr:hypothetical protein [Candidatus Dependentiae bacterium]
LLHIKLMSDRTYAVLAKHAASAGHAVYLEQRGIMPAHLTRENGKIPDFIVQREGGTTEAVDFTTATVLEYTRESLLHDTKPKPVTVGRARNKLSSTPTDAPASASRSPRKGRRSSTPANCRPSASSPSSPSRPPGVSAKPLSNGAKTSQSNSNNVNTQLTSPPRPPPTSKAHTTPRLSRSTTTTSPKLNSNSTDRTWSGASEPTQKRATNTSTTSPRPSSTSDPT